LADVSKSGDVSLNRARALEPADVANFRRVVRAFVDDVVAPRAAETDASGLPPIDNYRRAAKLGLTGLTIPADLGGSPCSQVVISAAIEEVARGCASTAMMLMAPIVVGELLETAGTPELRIRYLPAIASGDCVPAMAITEPDAGSDLRALRTVAVPRGAGKVALSGAKTYITNAGVADVFVIFAKNGSPASDDLSAWVVPAGTPGLMVGSDLHKLGLHGSSTAELHFDEMLLDESQRFGKVSDGRRLAISALDRARLNTAAQAVGIAVAALQLAVGFARTRVQFGQAIKGYQAVQIRIADMHIQLEAARAMLLGASSDFDNLPIGAERANSAAAAKIFCSDMANDITGQAVLLLGGLGFMREGGMERLMRDAKGAQIYDGTNDINRMSLARNLLLGEDA
jgi:alkylation response protein AidB-like acyl-CoA dehydrogenase